MRLRWTACALIASCAVGLVILWHSPLPTRLASQDSRVIHYTDGTVAYVFLSDDDKWRLNPATQAVDAAYTDALIRFEDKRFYSHPGVDIVAIARALQQNIRAGRVVSGASTLTMQLVRILEPRPRTLLSKCIEAIRALQLEMRLGKEAILAAYLRFAPFGRNIEGVGAASLAYFGHTAASLSPAEITYLLAVPQSPNARYPAPKNHARATDAVLRIAERLVSQRIFTLDAYAEIRRAKLPMKLRPFPRQLPHAAQWLAQEMPESTAIRTTLMPHVQQLAEDTLGSHRRSLQEAGIHNGSMVVMHNDTAATVALVGNFDFWDRDHQGQVVGFDAPRSPGSALKPFIYGKAIDMGLALPSYLALDVPVRFGTYAPKNYDKSYRGLVPLHEALSLSLNIPFVNLLQKIKTDTLLSFLKRHGVTTLSDDNRTYGLSLAIGAAEVTLLELTNLYAALSRLGEYRPVQLTHGPVDVAGKQMLKQGAAFLTQQALRQRDRPDFPTRRRHVRLPPQVFWKTGTSYGHRDAWALGSNGVYTVGVWLGNFDATPSKELVGGQQAGPILFDILDALTQRGATDANPAAPEDVQPIEVCSFSGYLPAAACPHTRETIGPMAYLPTDTCPFHRVIQVANESGHALCPLCAGTHAHTNTVFTALPTDVKRWIADSFGRLPQPPTHLPSCPQVLNHAPPKIVRPQESSVIYLIPGLPAQEQEIPLEAQAINEQSNVHWFADGKFIASVAAHEQVWWTPRAGKVELRAVDDNGRGDAVSIEVVNHSPGL